MLQYEKAVMFFKEDERWREKIAIGAGVTLSGILLIVPIFIVMGYAVRLLQNVRDGVQKPLPEWNQWGKDLERGLRLTGALLVWALPILLFMVPLVIGIILADENMEGFGVTLILCGSCLVSLYSLLLTVATPAITVAFARHETVRSALDFSKIALWTQKNLSHVILITIVSWAAALAFELVGLLAGIVLCGIGLLVTVSTVGVGDNALPGAPLWTTCSPPPL